MNIVKFALLGLMVAGVVHADEAPSAQTKTTAKASAAKTPADKRLKFMKSSVAGYEIVAGPKFTSKLSVVKEPLLRFTNPVSGLQDGGFVVWTSETGRPMVGAQVFLTGDDLWIHEFQSLAPVPLRTTRDQEVVWEPNRAGVKVKLVPALEPPLPAVQRLVQMRQIANRFSVSDEFEGRPQSDKLRLMSKPLLRFGKEGSDTLDGALFVYAHGTDPELMIVLEALKTDGDYRWHYSLSPMTGYALKASLDDKPIWEVAWRQPPYDTKDPFFAFVHSRALSLKSLLQLAK